MAITISGQINDQMITTSSERDLTIPERKIVFEPYSWNFPITGRDIVAGRDIVVGPSKGISIFTDAKIKHEAFLDNYYSSNPFSSPSPDHPDFFERC